MGHHYYFNKIKDCIVCYKLTSNGNALVVMCGKDEDYILNVVAR